MIYPNVIHFHFTLPALLYLQYVSDVTLLLRASVTSKTEDQHPTWYVRTHVHTHDTRTCTDTLPYYFIEKLSYFYFLTTHYNNNT